MKPIWKFRLLALLIVLVVGTVSIANFAAELLRPAHPSVPTLGNSPPTPGAVSAAALTTKVAPFREDLKADAAAMRAAEVLASKSPGNLSTNEAAQAAVRTALGIGPHDARMWLTLALLRAHGNLGDALIVEPLKMSYFTGPNQAGLIPPRLDLISSISAISDPDLQELAASDVRAILTRFADLRPLLVTAYARGSTAGKKLLDDSVKTIDPTFVSTLHGAH
jgi:hypothetical protein